MNLIWNKKLDYLIAKLVKCKYFQIITSPHLNVVCLEWCNYNSFCSKVVG